MDDDKIMKKVAMAVELVDALEGARKLAQDEIQSDEDWLKDTKNVDQGHRIVVMKQCTTEYKVIKLIDDLFHNPINGGSVYSRLYNDLKT